VNDTARALTTIADAADVGVEMTGPESAEPDTDVTYTFTVTNHGPGTARGISVFFEDYPGTFVSMTGAEGWECNDPGYGGRSPAGCNADALDPGESETFDLVVHLEPEATDIVTNEVVVSSLLDPNGANDDASVDTVIGTPPPPGPTAPAPPSGLTATAGTGEVDLAWQAPVSDGGSPITGYDVFVGTSSGAQGTTPANADPLRADATGYTVTGLTNGQEYFFVVKALNAVGRSTASNEASGTPFARTSVVYNGQRLVNAGFPLTPAALVSGPDGCADGSIVTFSLDANPLLGVDGEYVLGTVTANASGQATAAPVPTGDWLPGSYTIAATVEATPGCAGSAGGATVSVGSAGAGASGAGTYSLPAGGRVNFNFRVDGGGGTLRLVEHGRWQVRGTLSTFVIPETGRGIAVGTGDLLWWNAELEDWELAAALVPYTISFAATGPDGRTTPGAFGIEIDYTPVAPQPSALPNSAPQSLRGGTIALD